MIGLVVLPCVDLGLTVPPYCILYAHNHVYVQELYIYIYMYIYKNGLVRKNPRMSAK